MERKSNMQSIAIVVLTVAVLVMTVGFALYTRDLSINGTANIGAAAWDIHFKSDTYTTSQGSLTETSKDIGTTTMSYNVTLNKPGDFYEFTIDVENTGDFDANLTKVTLSSLTDAQKKYLEYKVTYGGTEYTQASNDVSGVSLAKDGGTETVKVRIAYILPDDAADLPEDTVSDIALNVTLSYVQA